MIIIISFFTLILLHTFSIALLTGIKKYIKTINLLNELLKINVKTYYYKNNQTFKVFVSSKKITLKNYYYYFIIGKYIITYHSFSNNYQLISDSGKIIFENIKIYFGCLFTRLLIYLLIRKLNKAKKNSVLVGSTHLLNDKIISELKKNKRNSKIDKVLKNNI